MDAALLEKFLHDRIKVNGKAGALGDKVKLVRDKAKINVTAKPPFSKRYLKYLSKKFLKKQQLRDWLRVIALNHNDYQFRYFNIQHNESDEEEEAEGEGEAEAETETVS
jgi:large subunit ribosomal protein L22e